MNDKNNRVLNYKSENIVGNIEYNSAFKQFNIQVTTLMQDVLKGVYCATK